MANSLSAAQNYLECDSCEGHPAQYFCKMCAGHLCVWCKSKHGYKKITRNHEIVSLTSNNEDMLDILYCADHTKKKLECYCIQCSEPVCTDCIIQSHNGHSVKSLTQFYKEFRDLCNKEIDGIENVLIPRYRELLSKEKEKRVAFLKRSDEIQMKIAAHTQNVVEVVKQLGKQSVGTLRNAEKDGLREMDTFTESIEENIKQLQLISKQMSEKLKAKPQISIFKSSNNNVLESLKELPFPTNYNLTDFQPHDINKDLKLGEPTVLINKEVKPGEPTFQQNNIFRGESDGEVVGKPVKLNTTSADCMNYHLPVPVYPRFGEYGRRNADESDEPVKIQHTYPSSGRYAYGYTGYGEYGRRNADESDKKVVDEPVKIQHTNPSSGRYVYGYPRYGKYGRRNADEFFRRLMGKKGEEEDEEKN